MSKHWIRGSLACGWARRDTTQRHCWSRFNCEIWARERMGSVWIVHNLLVRCRCGAFWLEPPEWKHSQVSSQRCGRISLAVPLQPNKRTYSIYYANCFQCRGSLRLYPCSALGSCFAELKLHLKTGSLGNKGVLI